MFRSLFIVLAALALVSVSAQSSSSTGAASSPAASSSSSSSYYSRLSSSSSYVAPNTSSTGAVVNTTASTGAVSNNGSSSTGAWVYNASLSSSSSSSSGYPANTYSVSYEETFGYQITAANIDATAGTVHDDIVYNLGLVSGASTASLASSVVVTSINGNRTNNGTGTATGNSTGSTGGSRRLLQTGYPGGVTFILLGSIVNTLPSFNPGTVVAAFVTAASNGQLVTKYTNATIPKQTIQYQAVGPVSSSTGGYGDNGASSAASASAALLFAGVASLALLL